jgi:hypothetical protein
MTDHITEVYFRFHPEISMTTLARSLLLSNPTVMMLSSRKGLCLGQRVTTILGYSSTGHQPVRSTSDKVSGSCQDWKYYGHLTFLRLPRISPGFGVWTGRAAALMQVFLRAT